MKLHCFPWGPKNWGVILNPLSNWPIYHDLKVIINTVNWLYEDFLRTVVVWCVFDLAVKKVSFQKRRWPVLDFYWAGLVDFSQNGLCFYGLNSKRLVREITTRKNVQVARLFTSMRMGQLLDLCQVVLKDIHVLWIDIGETQIRTRVTNTNL